MFQKKKLYAIKLGSGIKEAKNKKICELINLSIEEKIITKKNEKNVEIYK